MMATADFDRVFDTLAAGPDDARGRLLAAVEERIRGLEERLAGWRRGPIHGPVKGWLVMVRSSLSELAFRRLQRANLANEPPAEPAGPDAEAAEVLDCLISASDPAKLGNHLARLRARLLHCRERAEAAEGTAAAPHMALKPGEKLGVAESRLAPHLANARQFGHEARVLAALLRAFDAKFRGGMAALLDPATLADAALSLADLEAEKYDPVTDPARVGLAARVAELARKMDGVTMIRGASRGAATERESALWNDLKTKRAEADADLELFDAKKREGFIETGRRLAEAAAGGDLESWGRLATVARDRPDAFRPGFHADLLAVYRAAVADDAAASFLTHLEASA